MKLVANYVTIGVPKIFRKVVTDEHMRVYNIFANASGELYKIWNAEYNEMFSGPFDIKHYDSWMAEKVTAWIMEHTHSSILTFSVDPDNMNIIGHLKKFIGSKIYFYVTES